jgi:hypothetical protein
MCNALLEKAKLTQDPQGGDQQTLPEALPFPKPPTASSPRSAFIVLFSVFINGQALD